MSGAWRCPDHVLPRYHRVLAVSPRHLAVAVVYWSARRLPCRQRRKSIAFYRCRRATFWRPFLDEHGLSGSRAFFFLRLFRKGPFGISGTGFLRAECFIFGNASLNVVRNNIGISRPAESLLMLILRTLLQPSFWCYLQKCLSVLFGNIDKFQWSSKLFWFIGRFPNVRWHLVPLVRPGHRKTAPTESVSVDARHDQVAVVSSAKWRSMYICADWIADDLL